MKWFDHDFSVQVEIGNQICATIGFKVSYDYSDHFRESKVLFINVFYGKNPMNGIALVT